MNLNKESLPSNASFLDSDDDDEASVVVMASTAAACLLLSAAIEDEEAQQQENKRLWIKDYRKSRKRCGNTQSLMMELKPDSNDFKNFIRMDEESFNFILSAIRPDIEKQDTRMRAAINPEEKLSVTLRFLATGENFTELDYNSKLSQSFLSTAIIDVCEAIYKRLKSQYLKVNI